ncbi:hypothetical protein JQC76_09335 [Elizabethkingia anophelis]|uniref:exodeoxyribonuclease X C-terminal domain-containing protein n=1 Tax=Elizabethkingia anophelis TaxID=1117645 RepID=UPI00193B5C1B|nr:hypothetical protein [Elizabethkingia anophelis]QRI48307.1 hypothetical protein JQC76_09335 [Elizabethkingia anophelis]
MNIFQIWKEIGERVPFMVKKGYWSDYSNVLITRIDIKKYPYGDAYGISCNNGNLTGESEKLNSPGVYDWKLISDNFPTVNENITINDIDQSKNIFAYQTNTVVNFGKYSNENIHNIFNKDPKYIEWLIVNKKEFSLSVECIKYLKNHKKDYWFNKYALLINFNKLK